MAAKTHKRELSIIRVARAVAIEIRHLRYFLAIAEELNFTRAAERLHVAQQALSAAIRQLEGMLGAPLFTRTTRRVELTDAGRAFLPLAREAVAKVDAAAQAVRDVSEGRAGRLRVGLMATGGLEQTPRMLRAFAERYPAVAIEVRHFDFSDPTGGLADGSTDVAIVRPPFATSLELLELGSEPRYAVLPADHALAGLSSVTFDRLVDEPWMTADTDQVWCDFWSGVAYRNGPVPQGAECLSLDELFEAARAHRAIGLVPESSVRSQAWPGLSFVPVEDIEPSRVVVAWRDDAAVVRNFVALAARYARSG
jgi:DNA-binding transcriptional LysR family regulator